MRLKINFSARPAEEYFTVSGHKYKYDQSPENMQVSEEETVDRIRRLHQNLDGYNIELITREIVTELIEPEAIVVKDNPETGIDILRSKDDIEPALDVTFKIEGILGAVVIIGDVMGAVGDVELVRI